jgi:UDP-GlcNAc:undecaprenyl-phosphate GlcNAc-1-phosphate transferase
MVMGCAPTSLGLAGILAVVPLAGLPIFDTALVLLSRRRRGVRLLTGARDHLTHRLHARLHSSRRVALVLAAAQAALCLIALSLHALDSIEVVEAAAAYLICGLVALVLIERPLGTNVSRSQGEQPA